MLMRLSIIARLFHKINTFFKKFPRLFPAFFLLFPVVSENGPVKSFFSQEIPPVVKLLLPQKVEGSPKSRKMVYVNCFAYRRWISLWKTLVEKSVENVEKFEFSTGIRGFS